MILIVQEAPVLSVNRVTAVWHLQFTFIYITIIGQMKSFLKFRDCLVQLTFLIQNKLLKKL